MNNTIFSGIIELCDSFSISLTFFPFAKIHWWHYDGQIESESLSRSNELDQMREKLEYRKLVMGNMSMHSKVVKEKVRKQEEQLSSEIRSLLVGGSSLSVANKRMQVILDYIKYLFSFIFQFCALKWTSICASSFGRFSHYFCLYFYGK